MKTILRELVLEIRKLREIQEESMRSRKFAYKTKEEKYWPPIPPGPLREYLSKMEEGKEYGYRALCLLWGVENFKAHRIAYWLQRDRAVIWDKDLAVYTSAGFSNVFR